MNSITDTELNTIIDEYKRLQTIINKYKKPGAGRGTIDLLNFFITNGDGFVFTDIIETIKNFIDNPVNKFPRGTTLNNVFNTSKSISPATVSTNATKIYSALASKYNLNTITKLTQEDIDTIMDVHLKGKYGYTTPIKDFVNEIILRSNPSPQKSFSQPMQTSSLINYQSNSLLLPIDLNESDKKAFENFVGEYNKYIVDQFSNQKVIDFYDVKVPNAFIITTLINKYIPSSVINEVNQYNADIAAYIAANPTLDKLKLSIPTQVAPANAAPVPGTDKQVYKILEKIQNTLSYNVNKVLGRYYIPGLDIITVSMDGIKYKVSQGGQSRLFDNHRDVQKFVYAGAFQKDANPFKNKYKLNIRPPTKSAVVF